MASSLCKFSTIVGFVSLAIIFSDDQHFVKGDEDDLCLTPSANPGYSCSNTETCNNVCKGTEGAIEGICQDDVCFCIHRCQKSKLGGIPTSKLQGSCLDGETCQPQKLCERPSARFLGACFDGFNDNACNDRCVGGEGAAGGMCSSFRCSCYDNC